MLLSPSLSPPSLSLSFPFSLKINEKNLKNKQTKQQLYESVMSVTHPTRGPLRSLSGCSTSMGWRPRRRAVMLSRGACACRFRHLPQLGMGGGVKPGHPCLTHSVLAKVMCHLVCRAALRTFPGPGMSEVTSSWHSGLWPSSVRASSPRLSH